VTSDVLSQRALGRATLARQLPLERASMPAEQAIEHLVGMQAQAPNAPYVGLWTRLDGFRTEELADLMLQRRAVRTTLMRSTIHLVTARDCLALRPPIQAVCERSFAGSEFSKKLAGVDVDALLAAGRALLDERPRTRAELGPVLSERYPGVDADSLSYAVTYLLSLVQVTPRGVWGSAGPSAFTPAETWLGEAAAPASATPDDMVLRYFNAFGPASVMDAQAWSGLTQLREVVERLRPQLRVFRDENATELFDLPHAPRPDPHTPAAARFLPEYDNILLAHADRRRVMDDGRRLPLPPGNGGTMGTVLIDGIFLATWRITRQRDTAVLAVEPFTQLPPADRDALADEGARLLAFAATDCSTHDVQISR